MRFHWNCFHCIRCEVGWIAWVDSSHSETYCWVCGGVGSSGDVWLCLIPSYQRLIQARLTKQGASQ